jgi:hypothetical protein
MVLKNNNIQSFQMHQKFGKTWGRYSGLSPTIVTIDPEIIKEVMVKQV